MRVTLGDSGLCFVLRDVFQALLNFFVWMILHRQPEIICVLCNQIYAPAMLEFLYQNCYNVIDVSSKEVNVGTVGDLVVSPVFLAGPQHESTIPLPPPTSSPKQQNYGKTKVCSSHTKVNSFFAFVFTIIITLLLKMQKRNVLLLAFVFIITLLLRMQKRNVLLLAWILLQSHHCYKT